MRMAAASQAAEGHRAARTSDHGAEVLRWRRRRLHPKTTIFERPRAGESSRRPLRVRSRRLGPIFLIGGGLQPRVRRSRAGLKACAVAVERDGFAGP